MKAHPIHRVDSFEFAGPFSLRIRFEDASEQLIDFEPILHGEIYGPLRDPAVFHLVQIDPEVHTLIWPNGADFDPGILHNWPQHAEAMAKRAQSWQLTQAG